jgi:poly(hydroxyalkanoate) depolymerase family esterase
MHQFDISMQKALQLTREGRILEATKELQAAVAQRQNRNTTPQPKQDATPLPLLPPPSSPDQPSKSRKTGRLLRPLGEVINVLRRDKPASFGLEGVTAKRGRPDPDIPAGAKFTSHQFICPAGSRNYRLYVPKNRLGGRPPLLIMLHGCKQDPVDFAIGTGMNALAETYGLLVAYPGQSTSANMSACWNWFNPADQRHGMGEPSIIAGLTQEIAVQHDADPDRIFIVGLSAGGAMAAVMGATYPDLYGAIGVHSGLPYRSANDVVSAFAAMRGKQHGPAVQTKTKIIVFHGDADAVVHPANGRRIAATSLLPRESLQRTEIGVAAGGRRYTRMITQDRNGQPLVEEWLIQGAGHAWSGGNASGSYTDPQGPNASLEMLRFFLGESGE